MKKYLLLFVFFIGFIFLSQSQERAIGLRFGTGGEISYLHPMGDANRLELDLGVWSHGVNATAVYDWVFDIDGSFKWFTGVGASIGTDDYRGAIGVLGNIGVEYNFEIPLQLTADYRPAFFFGETGLWLTGFALGVRYKF